MIIAGGFEPLRLECRNLYQWLARRGRREDSSFLQVVTRVCAQSDDLDLLSLYAWALGRLRVPSELRALAVRVKRDLSNLQATNTVLEPENFATPSKSKVVENMTRSCHCD
jgi:hypothetical protein